MNGKRKERTGYDYTYNGDDKRSSREDGTFLLLYQKIMSGEKSRSHHGWKKGSYQRRKTCKFLEWGNGRLKCQLGGQRRGNDG